MVEEASSGTDVHYHRQGANEEMARSHREVSGPGLPVWGSSECSSPKEMSTSWRWEGKEYGRMLERQGVV